MPKRKFTSSKVSLVFQAARLDPGITTALDEYRIRRLAPNISASFIGKCFFKHSDAAEIRKRSLARGRERMKDATVISIPSRQTSSSIVGINDSFQYIDYTFKQFHFISFAIRLIQSVDGRGRERPMAPGLRPKQVNYTKKLARVLRPIFVHLSLAVSQRPSKPRLRRGEPRRPLHDVKIGISRQNTANANQKNSQHQVRTGPSSMDAARNASANCVVNTTLMILRFVH